MDDLDALLAEVAEEGLGVEGAPVGSGSAGLTALDELLAQAQNEVGQTSIELGGSPSPGLSYQTTEPVEKLNYPASRPTFASIPESLSQSPYYNTQPKAPEAAGPAVNFGGNNYVPTTTPQQEHQHMVTPSEGGIFRKAPVQEYEKKVSDKDTVKQLTIELTQLLVQINRSCQEGLLSEEILTETTHKAETLKDCCEGLPSYQFDKPDLAYVNDELSRTAVMFNRYGLPVFIKTARELNQNPQDSNLQEQLGNQRGRVVNNIKKVAEFAEKAVKYSQEC